MRMPLPKKAMSNDISSSFSRYDCTM
uniref:Uncharacterized protein n=1 Tax=Musa acuminata subsp. malaccensis TaxID=214687 RepID=A0A804KZ98_MUSAM